jgi:hypothetical protein
MAERIGIGDEPQKSGGGDANVLQLKDQTKIRLVDDPNTGVLSWRQHTIKHASDEDQVEFVVCPGPRICPLCRKPTSTVIDPETKKKSSKQNFPVSKRNATNVWDYETNSVKVLIAGPQVFDEFKAAKAVGIDPSSCDWLVHKMGKGISTKYKLVRGNTEPFIFAEQVGPDVLINTDRYGADTAPEKIFELLDKAGIDYDAIEVQTFTEEEALEFVLPFGRCKGLTIEQALAQDQEWCEWLHGQKLGNEEFGDPIFVALQTALEARGFVGPVDETPISTPEPGATPAVADETPVEAATPVATPDAGMVTLIAPDGAEHEVPESAREALEGAGYTLKPEPEPVAEELQAVIGPPYTMVNDAEAEVSAPDEATRTALEAAGFRVAGGIATAPAVLEITYPCTMLSPDGKEVPAPTAEARSALESAGFTLLDESSQASAAEEPPPEPQGPTPVLAEESVEVTIAGATVPMTFKAALVTAKAGTPVEFVDDNAAEYATLLISTGGEPPETEGAAAQDERTLAQLHADQAEPQAEPERAAPDPEKPFACELCDWAGKTKGSLTQHMKREHPDAEPAAAATPAAATPSPAAAAAAGAGADVRDRVKAKLAAQGSKDYKVLLAMFEEVTKETSGAAKRDISKFTEEELLALERRLDAEAA